MIRWFLFFLFPVFLVSPNLFANQRCQVSSVEVYDKKFSVSENLNFSQLYMQLKGKRLSRQSFISLLQNFVEPKQMSQLKEVIKVLANEGDTLFQKEQKPAMGREGKLMTAFTSELSIWESPLKALIALFSLNQSGLRVSLSSKNRLEKNFDPQYEAPNGLIYKDLSSLKKSLEQSFILDYRSPVIVTERDLYDAIFKSLMSLNAFLFIKKNPKWDMNKVLDYESLRSFYSYVLQKSLSQLEKDLGLQRRFLPMISHSLRYMLSILSRGAYHIKDESLQRKLLDRKPRQYFNHVLSRLSSLEFKILVFFVVDSISQYSNGILFFNREQSFEDGLNAKDSAVLNRMIKNAASKTPEETLEELMDKNFESSELKTFLNSAKKEIHQKD